MIYEAVCKKCGETFNPQPSKPALWVAPTEAELWGFTEDDLEHGWSELLHDVCYGPGELTGSWG